MNPSPISSIRAQKMAKDDDAKAFINAFERTGVMATWPTLQWLAILILYLRGPAQQAMDILTLQGLCDYKKLQTAVIQTLNLNLEAYHCHLHESEFSPHYHPWLIGQKNQGHLCEMALTSGAHLGGSDGSSVYRALCGTPLVQTQAMCYLSSTSDP